MVIHQLVWVCCASIWSKLHGLVYKCHMIEARSNTTIVQQPERGEAIMKDYKKELVVLQSYSFWDVLLLQTTTHW